MVEGHIINDKQKLLTIRKFVGQDTSFDVHTLHLLLNMNSGSNNSYMALYNYEIGNLSGIFHKGKLIVKYHLLLKTAETYIEEVLS